MNVMVITNNNFPSATFYFKNTSQTQVNTGWPRKNATTLIVNFMNIVDETELFFNLFGRIFIFQENDTMVISFG